MTKFLVTWDEYHECSAVVEAESEEQAEENWADENTHLDSCRKVQSIDNVEICEVQDDQKM